MSLRAILFISLFLVCAGGAIHAPLLGALGYMAHNILGPEAQWYSIPLQPLGIRYSLTLAVMTGVGIALNWKRLRPSGPILETQEWLMLCFLGVVWFSSMLGEATFGAYTVADHPSVKLAKAVIFVLMLTHVATDWKKLNWVFWLMIAATLILSLQAYGKPRSAFQSGRLENVGGVDFSESNFLAAFLVAMLPVIGCQFLRSAWRGKVVCLITGAFAANAIVLTRSRGAFLALGLASLTALLFVPRKRRPLVVLGLIVAAVGGYSLMDQSFIERMSTITRAEGERDRSAQSRIEIWAGGMRMMWANPLGVGAGNYMQSVGRYDPRNAGRDAHNSFVRCAGENGIPGVLLYLALILNAGYTLRVAASRAKWLSPKNQESLGLTILALWSSLAAVVGASCTVTLLYVENAWWFLALPVCALRAADNLAQDTASDSARFLEEGEMDE
jgi:putative inorganic carbon (hco3(-)) transporter